jgi:hypothetical protein
MKALSNGLGIFMMRIVNGRFAHHIMNMHRRLSKHLHDVVVKRDVDIFSAFRIRNEKCICSPIGNKESKNQPIGDKDKKRFRMWNVIFRMCSAIYYPHS